MKIGVAELVVIFIVALMVIGPDKLPSVMKQLGKGLAEFRKATDEATKEIKEGIVEPLNEAQAPFREALEPFEEMEKAVNGNVKDITKSLNSIGKPQKTSKTDTQKEAEAAALNAATAEKEEPEDLEAKLAAAEAQLAAIRRQMAEPAAEMTADAEKPAEISEPAPEADSESNAEPENPEI